MKNQLMRILLGIIATVAVATYDTHAGRCWSSDAQPTSGNPPSPSGPFDGTTDKTTCTIGLNSSCGGICQAWQATSATTVCYRCLDCTLYVCSCNLSPATAQFVKLTSPCSGTALGGNRNTCSCPNWTVVSGSNTARSCDVLDTTQTNTKC